MAQKHYLCLVSAEGPGTVGECQRERMGLEENAPSGFSLAIGRRHLWPSAGHSPPRSSTKIPALHRERQPAGAGVTQPRAVHASWSQHAPPGRRPLQGVTSGGETHSHGRVLQVTKGEQHGNVEDENKACYFVFSPNAVCLRGQMACCDITEG